MKEAGSTPQLTAVYIGATSPDPSPGATLLLKSSSLGNVDQAGDSNSVHHEALLC